MRKILYLAAFLTLALWGNAQSWTQQTSGVTAFLIDVFFINDSVGWVSTTGKVLKTTDAGNSWTAYTSGILSTDVLRSITFSSNNIGWAVGDGGVIYKTTDGGLNWSSQTSGTTKLLNSVDFVNDLEGWVVGYAGSNPVSDPGVILYTTNGGNTWSTQFSFFGGNIYSCQVMNDSTVFAVGDGGYFLKTTDNGTTWTNQIQTQNNTLLDLHFISNLEGWAVGLNGTIIKTTDGGVTWSVQSSGVSNPLYGIYFTSNSDGWAVGQSGRLLKTNNGGTNWSTVTSGITGNIGSINFSSPNKGWAVGAGGKIITYNPAATSTTAYDEELVSIYPNPTNNIANIEFESFGTYELKVLDISGKLVHSEELTAQNHQINTESWPTGVYRINITNEKGLMTSKAIVKQ